jgi:type II secretory pathway pseudopilin PulG
MAKTVIRDNRGMTLIEILISFVLVAVTSLALIQSSLVAMKTNFINELRNEAVKVAEQRMNELRNTPFPLSPDPLNPLTATTPPGATDAVVTRNIRGTSCDFTPLRTVTDVDVDPVTGQVNLKQIYLTIQWKYKNVNYEHSVSTVVRRQS